MPPPGFHDLIAMLKMRALRIEGDQHPFMANLRYFKDLLALPRARRERAHEPATAKPDFEPVVGRYLRLAIGGKPHRLYVEEAGQGIPLLCLHTAGADSRQYRALFNDREILERFRVIAFDLPWHGKSSPPAGWQNGEYKLTSRAYVDAIMAVVDALDLDRPVVIGCSIGGRVVLHLALEHARRFRALIGLESGAHAGALLRPHWLHRPDVHGGEVCGGLVSGLIAPTAPEADRWETIWHYMQGGPGVFKGDLHYYTSDGDVREPARRDRYRRLPALSADRRVRLFLHARRHARAGQPHRGRAGHHHGRARPLPRQRGPAALPRLPAARARPRSWHGDGKAAERCSGSSAVRAWAALGAGILGSGERDVVARRRDRLAAPGAVEARARERAEGGRQAPRALRVVLGGRLPELHAAP